MNRNLNFPLNFYVRPPPRTSVGIFSSIVSHEFKVRHCDLSCTERTKRNTESIQPSSKQLRLITGGGNFQSLHSRYGIHYKLFPNPIKYHLQFNGQRLRRRHALLRGHYMLLMHIETN